MREGDVFRALVIEPSVSVQAQAITNTVNNRSHHHPHNIPTGHWRDSLCGCCSLGCCHPSCCLSFFFFPVLLGQVMTRMKLSMTGMPSNQRSASWSPFRVILISVIIVAGIQYSVAQRVNSSMDNDVVQRLGHATLFVFGVYLLVLLVRTRYHIRETYEIPEQCCIGCEDCCCVYWCGVCTVSQMARHTADYRTYQAYYCTETGLGEGAPPTLDQETV